MLTKKMLIEYLESKSKIEDEVFKILKWYHENVKSIEGYKYLNNIDIGIDIKDPFYFSGTETWAYGGFEDHSFYLNTKYLYDEEFRKNAVIKAKKEKEEKKKAKKEKEEKKEIEEWEKIKKDYDKMKVKFG